MLKAVYWPNETARNSDGHVISVTVVQWDFNEKRGTAVGPDLPLSDVYRVANDACADLAIGVKPSSPLSSS